MRLYQLKRTRRRIRAVGLLVALVAMSLGAARAAPQWPVSRSDAQGTGRVPWHATYNPTLQWSMATNMAFTRVLGEDGTLYFGTAGRSFYAYSKDGTLKWTYRSSSSIGGSAALGTDGSVYFATTGQLIALDSNGASMWSNPFRFSGTAQPTSVIVGADRSLYFGTDDNHIYAVNSDGSEKWGFTTGGQNRWGVTMSPDGATIYTTSGDGRVYAIDSATGQLRWKTEAMSAVYNCAVGTDGTVYVGSTNGKLYALRANGTQKWAFQTQSKITCAPAIAADGSVYFGSQDMNLYAVDSNGQQKWLYRTGGPIYSAPTIDGNGTLLFSAWPGTLTSLDSDCGTVNWTRALAGNTYSSALVDKQGSVYVVLADGTIVKFAGPHLPEPSSVAAMACMLAGMAAANRRCRLRRRSR